MTAAATLALACAGLLSACATTAPAQLVDARAAYTASSGGLAAKLSPTEVHDAKKVLDEANQEFDKHGDTEECRDLANIAYRKLGLAEVNARTVLDRQKIAETVKAGVVNAATSELRAMKDLAAVAAVKEEARGMVITLSGSVLFAAGEFALLNTAMTKLDQVAEVLKAQDADKRMVVEGHTDSQGSDKVNQPLSLNRGNAVRDYLVTRGVAADKITVVGMGSIRPIIDNKSAENRANNRRVEIVINQP